MEPIEDKIEQWEHENNILIRNYAYFYKEISAFFDRHFKYEKKVDHYFYDDKELGWVLVESAMVYGKFEAYNWSIKNLIMIWMRPDKCDYFIKKYPDFKEIHDNLIQLHDN